MSKMIDKSAEPGETAAHDNGFAGDFDRMPVATKEVAERVTVSAAASKGPEGQAAGYRLADDLLCGAAEIAEFLFGDKQLRRRVFYLASRKGRRRLPTFRMGGAGIFARRSVIRIWISEQERE